MDYKNIEELQNEEYFISINQQIKLTKFLVALDRINIVKFPIFYIKAKNEIFYENYEIG